MAILLESTVNNQRFGRGNCSLDSNTAFGNGTLVSITTGVCNTGFGFANLATRTTGGRNTSFGPSAGRYGNGSYNTTLGRLAGTTRGNNSYGTHVGAESGTCAGASSVTIGHLAGIQAEYYSVSIGHCAGRVAAAGNVSIGWCALATSTSQYTTAVGARAASLNTTGDSSTIAGHYSGRFTGNATNNTLVGFYAYQHNGYGVADQAVLGRGQNNVCNCVWRAWKCVSDFRDKTNIKPLTNLGLNFIRKLNPIKYKWDSREEYAEQCGFEYGVKDGTLKQDKTHYGFLAQEVDFASRSAGEKFEGVTHDTFRDKYSLSQLELVASLTKALQEINDDLDLIQTKINSKN